MLRTIGVRENGLFFRVKRLQWSVRTRGAPDSMFSSPATLDRCRMGSGVATATGRLGSSSLGRKIRRSVFRLFPAEAFQPPVSMTGAVPEP